MDTKLSRRSLVGTAGTLAGTGLLAASLPFPARSRAQDATTLVVETYQWDEAGFSDWMQWVSDKLVEQYPNVTVERRATPFTEYWDKLLTNIQAGTVGDIFQGNAQNFEQWVAVGGLEPMNEWLDMTDISDHFASSVIDRSTIDGMLYGLPTLYTTNQVMIYNQAQFDAAGVSMPGAGEQDAWLEISQQLTSAPEHYGVVVHTLPTNQLNEDYSKFITAWGTQYSLPDGTPTFDHPENIAATEFYKAIITSGATPIGTEKTIYRPMVWDGKISQLIDGSWVFGMAASSGATALDQLTAAPLPFPDPRGNLIFNVYCMSAKAKAKPEAAAWMQIASSAEAATKFMELTGSPHARSVDVPEDLRAKMPWLDTFIEVLQSDLVEDLNPGYALVRNESEEIIRRNAADCLLGDTPVADALSAMQREHEELSAREGGETN